MARPDANSSRGLFISLIVLSFVAVACFAYPLYVIWPFRHQGATELGVALWVKRMAPWLSILCAALSATFLVVLWPRLRRLGRIAGIALVFLAVAACYASRVNVYELMFHPAGTPQFVAADHAKVDADDMVVAVKIDKVSRAYPIREMAYHHIINDTVAGEPIAATY